MINCQNISQYRDAYLDKALEPATARELENHLVTCPACRSAFETEARIERKLGEILLRPETGDEALWQKALSRIPSSRPRFLKYLVPLSAAALMLIIFGALILFPPGATPALVADAIQEHLSSLQPGFQLGITTDSPATLTEYFTRQGNLTVRECGCPMSRNGCLLKGGRACSLRAKPAAHILLDYQGTPVSVFILSEKDRQASRDMPGKLDAGVYQTEFRGFNCAMCRRDEKVICAVGAVKPEILKQLLTDIETYVKQSQGCQCQ